VSVRRAFGDGTATVEREAIFGGAIERTCYGSRRVGTRAGA